MTLSEVYFYMLIILIQVFAFLIITTTEDLKHKKYYKTYLKIATTLSCIGVLIELCGWNYLCPFQCILLSSSPFIALNIIKSTIWLFIKLFKEEPFQIYRRKLSDGIWVDNKGNIDSINYYILYSTVITGAPIILIFGIFLIIEKNFC